MVSNWTPLKSKSFKAHSSHADKQFNYKPMHFNPKKISWINGINKKPNFCLEVALCGIGGNLGDLWSSRLQRGSDSALQHSVQRAAAPCCRRMQDTLYTHSLGSLDSSPYKNAMKDHVHCNVLLYIGGKYYCMRAYASNVQRKLIL